jgi:hypothetical protein
MLLPLLLDRYLDSRCAEAQLINPFRILSIQILLIQSTIHPLLANKDVYFDGHEREDIMKYRGPRGSTFAVGSS